LTSFSKPNQTNPNKKACISLDSFGRIGAFQWVTANPNKKFLFLGHLVGGALNWGDFMSNSEDHSVDSASQKENVQKVSGPS
jgi:hypothetical protein